MNVMLAVAGVPAVIKVDDDGNDDVSRDAAHASPRECCSQRSRCS